MVEQDRFQGTQVSLLQQAIKSQVRNFLIISLYSQNSIVDDWKLKIKWLA